MDDLVAFLRARLDEEAFAAQAVPVKPLLTWRAVDGDAPGVYVGDDDPTPIATIAQNIPERYATPIRHHIAWWNPDRVLREVAVKRALIDRYASARQAAGPPGQLRDPLTTGVAASAEAAVRQLAAVYRDHPDFRPEWLPVELW